MFFFNTSKSKALYHYDELDRDGCGLHNREYFNCFQWIKMSKKKKTLHRDLIPLDYLLFIKLSSSCLALLLSGSGTEPFAGLSYLLLMTDLKL